MGLLVPVTLETLFSWYLFFKFYLTYSVTYIIASTSLSILDGLVMKLLVVSGIPLNFIRSSVSSTDEVLISSA